MEGSGLEFSQHLVRNDQKLLRYIMTFVPRRPDAEEVLQRTATALWEKYNEFDRTRDFLPWALRFAYIEVLNFRKERARERLIFNVDVLNLLKETRDQLNPDLDRRLQALRHCLEKVDATGLSLLRRRYCDSEKMDAIAVERGQTSKALYRRLDRIREKIANCVERRLSVEELSS